ncbi:Two component transcriptional regulator, LytTR family protein [Candidatus Sulfopaludibacter sp. SbA4]|nr:Two component transcriptional regulator, LytTR family protein [Candidatus Sulfopaludibacter sp. SbA4]
MRVLIVDDEAPARVRLRQMLSAHADVELVGEAETGVEAMQLAAELKPDVILLDIQMPGCSGIDVAACLAEPRPRVIFCTAYDQHAVDAFELNAVDYLLKPISRVRLSQALDRVRSLAAGRRSDSPLASEGVAALDLTVRTQRTGPARFLVRNAAHYIVVGESRVLYFASEGGLTKLVGDGAQYWMDPTLNELEQRLDPARFFRVSRAALINLNAVAEVFPFPGGSGEVLLKNGQRLEVSRRRFRDLLEALGGERYTGDK